MITKCAAWCCKTTLGCNASNDDTLRSKRSIQREQQECAEHSWEWIDACPTQEDARRLDKTLRCGGGYWVALLRVCKDCTSWFIMSDLMIALNEVWRLRGRGGRRSTWPTSYTNTNECLWSDSIDVDGILMCNIKSLHVKEHTLSDALMLWKFYWWCVSKFDV